MFHHYFRIYFEGQFVHHFHSDNTNKDVGLTKEEADARYAKKEDVLTKEEADELYVSKAYYDILTTNISALLGKIIKPVVPTGFVVHAYNPVTSTLAVSYRGPFEWAVYYKDFNPFIKLGGGKSPGGDNQLLDFSSVANGTYWIVFIYAGQTFRVQVTKQ